MAYVADEALYKQAAEAVFSLLAAGVLQASVKAYPLDQAARAQADLESGNTNGSLVLVP
ncbi:NADPH:quinone reductase-like Zn-dependent oxidoreductase [Rhizobium sp. BK529]|uniref:zinc-binding dehydrogenase n=1 Tax=Rhizobium sp. BK529 TaxID=2586983 RepID=UPI00161DB468|nr:zinc-binding dehydrogenase [Rhizobium sp. BK529]MBB3594898.1 NADPH:quinone reductase-like Zn-dependent oxidoreductase [Rhizobium sp. BK529]